MFEGSHGFRSNDSGSSGGSDDSGSPGDNDDSGSSGGSDDSGSDDGGTSSNIIEEATYQGQLIELVNQYRAEGHTCGSEYYPPADPLTWNSKLESAARRHSRDMADNDFFSHTGSDGTNVADRAREAGYDYSYIAENIAAGYKTPEAVMEAWMASPPHCTSIMSKNYREFGNAMVWSDNTQYPTYWTMVFGDQ
ncbi:MAG: CAP domain-containing protein [Gammaproteobacteria bacterium]|nr:MAG: CAP domain-containing protein [Gammaproteobacteria bacterium]